MKRPGPRLRAALIAVAFVAAIPASYWVGYQSGHAAGLLDQGPRRRALVVVTRSKTNPNSTSNSLTWFDLNKPEDVARLRAEEARLKSLGADYYVANARVETHVTTEPDPRRANSHR